MYPTRRGYHPHPSDHHQSTHPTSRHGGGREYERTRGYERSRYYNNARQYGGREYSNLRYYDRSREYDTNYDHQTTQYYDSPRFFSRNCNSGTMADNENVFVYHHLHREHEGNPLFDDGSAFGRVTRAKLNEWLQANPEYQMTKKPLTNRFAAVYQKDMLTEEQQAGVPKVCLEQQRASVEIPRRYWYVPGTPRELIIVSRKRV